MEVFDTGEVRTRGEVVSALKSFHARVSLDIPVFLIRHSNEGLILFGTGLSPKKERQRHRLWDPFLPKGFKYKQKKGRDIVSQLRARGVGEKDVKLVIIPYFSAESAGMIDAFPEARVVISRREWQWRESLERDSRAKEPLSPTLLRSRIKLESVAIGNSPAFGPFENGIDLLQDGSLILVSLPGRTPGNMGLWVNLDEGPVLLTGGASYVVDNYLDLSLPIRERVGDLDEFWRSLHIIQAAARDIPRLIVVPGNDLTPLRLLRRKDVILRREK